MAIEMVQPPGRRQEDGDAAVDGIHRPADALLFSERVTKPRQSSSDPRVRHGYRDGDATRVSAFGFRVSSGGSMVQGAGCGAYG